jgi:hypothetical protein
MPNLGGCKHSKMQLKAASPLFSPIFVVSIWQKSQSIWGLEIILENLSLIMSETIELFGKEDQKKSKANRENRDDCKDSSVAKLF